MGHDCNEMTTHNMQVLVYGRLQARREEEVEQQAAGPRAVHVRILPAGVRQHITIYISTISILGRCGVCLSIVFLVMEHLYFKYVT